MLEITKLDNGTVIITVENPTGSEQKVIDLAEKTKNVSSSGFWAKNRELREKNKNNSPAPKTSGSGWGSKKTTPAPAPKEESVADVIGNVDDYELIYDPAAPENAQYENGNGSSFSFEDFEEILSDGDIPF